MSPPFSNSETGELFIANRCHRCAHRVRDPIEAYPCADFTPAYIGQWPEILYRASNPAGVECRRFEADDGVTAGGQDEAR